MNNVKKIALDTFGKSIIVKQILAPNNFKNSLAQHLDKLKLIKSKPTSIALTSKVNDVISWYDQVTGMNEVREAQRKVVDAEAEFIKAQERRREANKELSSVQNKLKELYSEIDATSRGEERYIVLVTKEHQMLKEEKRLFEEFNSCERRERDLFSILSSAVKESHEKERTQAERTKYWSLIGSVVGTLIGVIGSSFNNRLKMKELKELIIESQSTKLPVSQSIISPPIIIDTEEIKEIVSGYHNDSRKLLIIASTVLLITYLLRSQV